MKNQLKTQLGIVTATALIALVSAGTAIAQDNTGSSGSTGTSSTGSGTSYNSSERRDNGTNWAWLGLLGLGGLAGLRRPQQHTTVTRESHA